jgi:hypothetical protein
LTLAATGTGDIAEMTETLQDDEAAYAYVRMKLGNDEYSERVKFAFVVWAGTSLLHLTPPLPTSSLPHEKCPLKLPCYLVTSRMEEEADLSDADASYHRSKHQSHA